MKHVLRICTPTILLAVLAAFSIAAHATGGNNGDGCHGNCPTTGGGGATTVTNNNENANTTTVSTSTNQTQSQVQGQTQTATGGAGGAGGEGGKASSKSESSSGADASANNEGNSLTVTNDQVRQAPSMGAPDVFPTAVCQGGVSGAAAAPGFGLSFGKSYSVTESCLFVLAQNYMALGMTEAACEVLNATQSAKKAGVKPSCKPVDPAPLPAAADLSEYPKRDEVNQKIERAFIASQAK